MQHTPFDPLPRPEYKDGENREKQLQAHMQKLKKQFSSKEHKKLWQKAKSKWEEELNSSDHTEELSSEISVPEKKMTRQEKRREKKKQQELIMIEQAKQEESVDHRQIELDAVEKVLKTNGLSIEKMIEIEGDGDCLFSSIAYELSKVDQQYTAIQLREMSVDHLEANIKEYEPFYDELDGMTFQQYLSDMRNTKLWGGYLELIALAKVLNLTIVVYSMDGKQIIHSGPLSINLLYLKHYLGLGEHYNCLE